MVFEELIIRSLRGETTPSEEHKLRRWRASSREHERRYQQLVRLWELRDLVAPRADEGMPSARDIMSGTPGTHVARRTSGTWRRRRAWWPLWSAAAAAAGVTALAYAVGDGGWLGDPALGPGSSPSPIDLVTDAEEQSTVRLGDGTVVRLAGHSRLRVEGTDQAREAWLDGRAFFAVAHDTVRPFVVRTPAGEVHVKGTRFDLESRGGLVRVAVLDGLVELSAKGRALTIRPGEAGEILPDGEIRVRIMGDVYGHLSWMGDFIAFEATPLRVVAEELERRYGLEIRLLGEGLAERAVTIWSTDQRPDQVIEVICRAVQAVCTEQDGVVSMS